MSLDDIRKEIDRIDNAIKPLFMERMECAKHVAEVKSASGGEVFVPEREQAVIRRRSSDVGDEVRDEYVEFLRHLMSVCRSYEYGLLEPLQEQVVEEAFAKSGLSPAAEHDKVEISFCCSYEESTLNVFLNMAKLNKVGVLGMRLEIQDGKQQVTMMLDGNVKEKGIRRLLCQIEKEAEEFRILSLC